MKIQIIHSRDPDSECSITVYIDGVRRDDVEVEDIDPGAGYEPEDYEPRRAETAQAASTPDATQYDRDLAQTLMDARFEKFGL
jgi:hypothetical protein